MNRFKGVGKIEIEFFLIYMVLQKRLYEAFGLSSALSFLYSRQPISLFYSPICYQLPATSH